MYLHWLLYRQQDEACPAGEALFELNIELDRFPIELSWSLVTVAGDNIFISPEIGVQYRQPIDATGLAYVKDICIPSGSYTFTFSDSFGDGLSEGGSYTLTVQGDVVKQGGIFEFSEVTNFDVDAGTPMPTPQPTLAAVAPTVAPVVATSTPVAPVAPGTTVEVAIFIAFDLYPEGTCLVCVLSSHLHPGLTQQYCK